eukprot:TRINITY_DN4183_c0_g1_i1.p1 TRINITY_DN4183_c0_g1~~TRINITY_DN4183_c0_g1_i1.p1  ORF type:complete len:423 (-),score=91.99 TRINITY_DN4183_c0_g1_i1:147-1265(-)
MAGASSTKATSCALQRENFASPMFLSSNGNNPLARTVRKGSSIRRQRDGRMMKAKSRNIVMAALKDDETPASTGSGMVRAGKIASGPPALEEPQTWLESRELSASYPPVLKPEYDERTTVQKLLFPDKSELPDDVEMSIWDHLEEFRQRILVASGAVGAAMLLSFCFAKELVRFLEAPVYSQGVRFLQLSPGEYFFTTLKVSGYCGLLLGSPVVLYEVIAFVLPGLTLSERRFLGPIVLGSSVLFYAGIAFSYTVLTPAALQFFIAYAEGVVESLWSIDRYFEFVLVLMFSTGLSFQVPVIQLLLGQTGLVSSQQMLSVWRYIVVGAVAAAAVLTPSTDPLTQLLLAGPLIGLYIGGALLVRVIEGDKAQQV